MKQTIKTSRVAGQLEKMFRALNSRFFGGELPEVVISLKKTAGAYERYTDQVEPYGMDECWLDISGTESLFGSPEKVANEIRETMKFELGLTISVGVSFNKIFAKLGSDMKKPDAVTVIPKDTFKEKIWGLPAADLLGVGRATQRVLDSYCIRKYSRDFDGTLCDADCIRLIGIARNTYYKYKRELREAIPL